MGTVMWALDGRKPVRIGNIEAYCADPRSKNNRSVAKTNVNGVNISTVFLMIDHSFNGGPPVLFETMVFGGPLDGEQERYHTYDEAEAGHAAMVERVKQASP